MKKVVAVEDGLTPVKEYLNNKGYEVVTPTQKNIDSVHVIVVTGSNTDFLGIEDTSTKAAVIDASGMTPEEIYKAVEAVEKQAQ